MVEILPKLSQNLLEILDNDREYYDITIEVGIDPHVKIFRAHMIILDYRSPYLRRILSTNKKKNNTTLTHIKLPNILPEIFQIILRYIYGGKLSLEEYDSSDIIKILVTANELGLRELIPCLESFLIVNKTNWMEQNFNLIYQTSFENNSFLKLQKYCNNLISKEPNKILKSSNLFSISEKLLISIIQSDNLKMSDIQVWDYVLKWGFSQNPELSSDPTNYSKDDFNILKNTLRKCIHLIKFHNFTSKEFSDKVMPFKKIFPKELYKNLLKDFLNNDSKPIKLSEPFINEEIKEIDLDSGIIKSRHDAEVIWIEQVAHVTSQQNWEYEQFIKKEEAGKTPLVCSKEKIRGLYQEYAGSEVYRQKIMKLAEKHGDIRRCRDDGNCFYRAFGFSWFERLMNSKDPILRQSTLKTLASTTLLLKSAEYQPLVYEDVYDIFEEQMKAVANGECDEDMLLTIFQSDEISNYIVYYLRLITAAYLKLHRVKYEPFLEFKIGMDKFCTNFVEIMDQEADHIHVIALTKALKVPVEITYISESDTTGQANFYGFYPDEETITLNPLVLLYRPGHYDILYRRE